MTPIYKLHEDIERELRRLARVRAAMKRSEQQIRYLIDLLFAQLPESICDQLADEGSPLDVPDAMLKRAANALRQIGLCPMDQRDLECPTGLQDKLNEHTPPPPTGVDMRAIERTSAGKYRCTKRKGKRRLISEVFETAEEARAARDALEHQLRRALPVRAVRGAPAGSPD